MTKEEKKKCRLARAKSTALGRFICRLFGDEVGQGMMEYVIIGTLVVAAVVAIAIAFSDGLQNRFKVMLEALFGHTNAAATITTTGEASASSSEGTADANHGTVTGGGQ